MWLSRWRNGHIIKGITKIRDIRFENKDLYNEQNTIVLRIRNLESILKLY